MSLNEIREVPIGKMIVLAGPPGAGKSAFCHQAVLQSLSMGKPVIFVTTGSGASEVEKELRERGLGVVESGLLRFVDAYNETVGLSVAARSDTAHAHCEDLSSIGIAISKQSDQIGRKGVLMVFDSLTSPYLLAGSEVLRFMKVTLSRFAAEGNSVVVCMDEGCGKEEDLGAMMSIANGIVRMEVEDGLRVLNVVKHPEVEPTRIEIPTDEIWERKVLDFKLIDREIMGRVMGAMQGGAPVRKEVGNYVNVFWPNLAKWSNIVWDPKRYPEMIYDFYVDYSSYAREMITLYPWHMRLLFKLFVPKSFSKVRDMKKASKFLDQELMKGRRYGVMEYLEDVSKTDEHYFRVYESRECCGFEGVGAAMATDLSPMFAGICKGFEREEREWNAIETKCVALGDAYCEVKVVPGEIEELKDSLRKDSSIIGRIHERLMQRVMRFVLDGEPLVERPRLGAGFFMGSEMNCVPMIRERYRMAFRMGGARTGKQFGECLLEAGKEGDEAVRCMVRLLTHCKVGKVRIDKTIRIIENCESYWTTVYAERWEEPCCFFTTGFLNGFFSAVKNQHVKETKCIAMGDPYCEWEFR